MRRAAFYVIGALIGTLAGGIGFAVGNTWLNAQLSGREVWSQPSELLVFSFLGAPLVGMFFAPAWLILRPLIGRSRRQRMRSDRPSLPTLLLWGAVSGLLVALVLAIRSLPGRSSIAALDVLFAASVMYLPAAVAAGLGSWIVERTMGRGDTKHTEPGQP